MSCMGTEAQMCEIIWFQNIFHAYADHLIGLTNPNTERDSSYL